MIMNNFNLRKNKKGFVGTALLIAIFVVALVVVIFLALRKNDSVVYKSSANSGNVKVLAQNDETVGEGESVGVSCDLVTSKEDKFQSNITVIKDAAKDYFTVNRMPKSVGDKVTLTLKEMQEEKMVLPIKDNEGKACDVNKSYVEVTKESDEYVMKVYLSCDKTEDYILVHIGCYDFCNNKCEETSKEYEYEYKKTTACTLGDWSAWSNWSTIKESTNSNKKEDVKTEKKTKEVIDTRDASQNPVTYNCNKYPGYTLKGDKCIKKTTTTDTVDATYSDKSYNCNKYPGYTLKGKYCVKEIEETETYDADKDPVTYNCNKYPGYTLSGKKCVKEITRTDTIDATVKYSCSSGYTLSGTKCTRQTTRTESIDATVKYTCPSGYKLSGTKCFKESSRTDTIGATPIYQTRSIDVEYPCNEQRCTTKTVMDCTNGCQMVPQTSCETVQKTCHQTASQQYISGYKCSTGYTLSGTKCTRTITETDTVDATKKYTCPSDYKLSGKKCTKEVTETDTQDAENNPTTYNCNKYENATLSGKKCIVKTTSTDRKPATETGGGYVCKDDYTLSGTKCTREITTTDKKDATKTGGEYTCPSSYTLSGKKCTKKTTKEVEVKYYRYATRNCTGGSTDIKWSKNSNDKTLINSGYVRTGNKKVVTSK